jgi:hypothetical protein
MTEEEIKHDPSEEAYEHQDLSASTIYAFLISLLVGGLIVYFIVWGMYRYMDARIREHQPPPNPLVQQAETDTRTVPPDEIKKFPEPRLEKNERIEITDFRLKEEQILNSYGWIDQKAGIVHIPIDHAMELLAQRGLPTTPKAGAVPPSEVNVVNQAAQRSDTSKEPGKTKAEKPKQ